MCLKWEKIGLDRGFKGFVVSKLCMFIFLGMVFFISYFYFLKFLDF